MDLGLLVLRFHLEGCNSLKEKRHRLAGLRDRFGKHNQVGVCESYYQDQLSQAEYTFSCLGHSREQVNQILADIEKHAATCLDAVIYDRQREWL
jgi:uncharacterized protein YlxP (DUF503 family)